jgi:hypothetical protein
LAFEEHAADTEDLLRRVKKAFASVIESDFWFVFTTHIIAFNSILKLLIGIRMI